MVKMNPRSKDARNKFNECQKAVKRLAFEEAIATERTLPPSDTVKIDDIGEEAAWRGRRTPRAALTSRPGQWWRTRTRARASRTTAR